VSSRPSSFTLTKPGPLRIYSMTELLKLPPPEWLVENVLPAGGLIGLYGEPGSFKSFIAIDIAMSIATGLSWHGAEVRKGHVIYVAAEGGTGISKRAAAWLQHRRIRPENANISWVIESMAVNPDSEQMETLLTRVSDEMDVAPELIIVDTLARCFDGDENTQEDMGRFVAGVDRMRREFDSTVMVVHHTRLGGDRERGNTAFRGAADTMIVIQRNESDVDVVCNKQKDAQEFPTRQLAMKPIVECDSVVFVDAQGSKDDILLSVLNEPKPLREIKVLLEENRLTMSPASIKRRLSELIRSGKIIRKNAKYEINRLT
jgi:hypothetical protein